MSTFALAAEQPEMSPLCAEIVRDAFHAAVVRDYHTVDAKLGLLMILAAPLDDDDDG